MLNNFMTRISRRWLTLACLPALATVAHAEGTADSPAAPARSDGVMSFTHVRVEVAPPAARPESVAGAGLVAALDPATGKLVRPSADDMAELQRQAAATSQRLRSLAAPRETRAAGGGVSIALDESFDSYVVVRRNADGSLEQACEPGEQNAQKALSLRGRGTSVAKGELK